jgi:hypothetical protein
MKLRITALLLAVLLFLTGCAPINHPEQEWNYDFGTTPENIFNGSGNYAVNDSLIYISKISSDSIREYDRETGETVEYFFPKEKVTPPTEPKRGEPWSTGNLFLLSDGLCYINFCNVRYPYQDENGKTQWFSRLERTLNIFDLETGTSTPIEELGKMVHEVIPVKKKTESSEAQPTPEGSDNPLAGMELYCFFGYDTFPEMAAQLAQDGIMLEEPKDPNERNKYYVLSIGRLDGDTRQLKVLFRGAETFFMDDQNLYAMRLDENEKFILFCSDREQIDFQPLDVGPIGNKIAPYDGGFYFFRPESWQVCRYQDGMVTELPVASCSFMRWRDQLIYNDLHWEDGVQNGRMKSYDLNTGEIRDLGVSATVVFSIFDDRYLICEQTNETDTVDILVDLETREQRELYRIEQ